MDRMRTICASPNQARSMLKVKLIVQLTRGMVNCKVNQGCCAPLMMPSAPPPVRIVLTTIIIANRKSTKAQPRRVSRQVRRASPYHTAATPKKKSSTRRSQNIVTLNRKISEKIQRARGSKISIRLLRSRKGQVTSMLPPKVGAKHLLPEIHRFRAAFGKRFALANQRPMREATES